MRLARMKGRCAMAVLIGSVVVGVAAAAVMPSADRAADVGTDLGGVIAVQLALLTSPGHDPHRPAGAIASWSAVPDRALARAAP